MSYIEDVKEWRQAVVLFARTTPTARLKALIDAEITLERVMSAIAFIEREGGIDDHWRTFPEHDHAIDVMVKVAAIAAQQEPTA